HPQTGGQALQEPNVRDGAGQLDVGHAFPAYLGNRDFYAALLADDATVLQAFVFTAKALVIFDRAKDLGAKQAVAFRLERTVVDGLWLANFAERPRTDLFGRGDADLDGIKLF